MNILKTANYRIDELYNQELKLSNDINMPTSQSQTVSTPVVSSSQSIETATTSSTVDASLSSLSASLTAAFVQQMSQNSKPLLYSFVTLEGNKKIC